jgi:hypothetical protein
MDMLGVMLALLYVKRRVEERHRIMSGTFIARHHAIG